MKLELIIEKGDGEFWGRIEGKGNFLPTTVADTVNEVMANIKTLIADYLENEGKDDKFWKKVNLANIEFDLKYDLQAFFAEHDFLNITSIAKYAGINGGLLRQYVSGVKHPSADQAKKIEDAIHRLAKKLQDVSIYA